jgi:hypothetical protein
MNVYKASDHAVRHFIDWTEASEAIEDMQRAHFLSVKAILRRPDCTAN